jgi:hypothetical protein
LSIDFLNASSAYLTCASAMTHPLSIRGKCSTRNSMSVDVPYAPYDRINTGFLLQYQSHTLPTLSTYFPLSSKSFLCIKVTGICFPSCDFACNCVHVNLYLSNSN